MSGTKAGAAKRHQTQPVPSVTQEGRAESRPDLSQIKRNPGPAITGDLSLMEGQPGYAKPPVYVVPPKRSLMHQGRLLQAGEVVEGAHKWLRLESWINTGRIVLQR